MEWAKIVAALAAFIGFSLVASGAYLLNDLADTEADRLHASKKQRPIAAGKLSRQAAWQWAALLIGLGLAIGWLTGLAVFYVLVAYALLTSLYSFRVKAIFVLDVMLLTLFYILRIAMGHAATHVKDSFWLFSFCGFIFFSLALLKRYIEISAQPALGKIAGRGYCAEDASLIAMAGVSSGLISILVLALYLNSPDVLVLYHEPRILWAWLPVMATWILRMWFLGHRQEIDDDPVLFAMTDRFTYGCMILLPVIALGAKF